MLKPNEAASSMSSRSTTPHSTASASVVPSLCPYCGVGCQVNYHVADNRIVQVTGRWGPSNEGRLCVKGRFGYDYAHHAHRLTAPLVRREGVSKDALHLVDPANPWD